ncbi:endonuclease/exonuclease/phosphatase family protein [Streptomyces sp. B1866]|uniref:endonuclease/exonuclease/phosphatase family protein n=1 Tax=Streptomyces sp. B1866 TaxID=3075431 RepID=UPI00288DD1C0|nr:endonuclease/exonuclease/phosphatase family protein [Streptomyces sp. B1866]MDT3399042.1 endonuclease/exonuclease/phosphatase family protein [Streptomyces sp. B1866]
MSVTPVLADLPRAVTEPDSAVIRVLSYNVRSLRDDRHALARVVRACAPDVLCVQEAPRFFRWRKAASWLARETGLVYTTGGATTAGPMILTSLRAHVERTEEILLPRTPGLHQRGLATAVLRFGGLGGSGAGGSGAGQESAGQESAGQESASAIRLGVVCCHLSLSADERYAQAGLVLDRVAALGVPCVVAGDLNDRPGGRAFRRLTGTLRDGWETRPWGGAFTSTPDDPHQRIDAVLATERVDVLGCGVPAGLPGVADADLRAATDHLPVLAAVRVPRLTAAG